VDRKFRKIIQQAGLAGESTLLLAVSGGIDSVVLLDLLSRVASDFDLRLHVLHVDHQIRPESRSDAEFVRELCARLGIPCRVETFDVSTLAKERRLSLETAGREVRRAALSRRAEEHGCVRIVLAHHQDDQAETFLQRLLRGSGLSGLQVMQEFDGFWWRPLLDFSRQQILTYAKQRNLVWVEDASNVDTRFLRNRIRHQLLPDLREYNPQVNQRLSALSRQFQLEEDFWSQHISSLWSELLLSDADGLRLNRQLLLDSHPALQLRLLREALRRCRGDLQGIERVHLEALLGLVLGDRSQAELDLPDCWAARRYNQIWLRSAALRPECFELSLKIGEPLALPDGRILWAELREHASGEADDVVEFEPGLLQFPLRVRSLQPGDRFRPSGMKGHRKIKDFLIDLKFEKEQRICLPLLMSQDEIVWLVGLRRSAVAPVVDRNRKCLVVRLLKDVKSATKPL